MTFMPIEKGDKPTYPGSNNPIGGAGEFKIAGNDNSAGELLANIGNRLSARASMNANARAMLDIAKVEAVTKHYVTKLELQAAAEAQQRAHENAIKLARINNAHELKKINLESEQGRMDQLQSTNNVHGVLDRMVTDFPNDDLDFKTERGESIRITRPKGASSEDSEGGSLL
jgi:hypothetical protein